MDSEERILGLLLALEPYEEPFPPDRRDIHLREQENAEYERYVASKPSCCQG